MNTTVLGNLVDIHNQSIYPAEISIENGQIINIVSSGKPSDTYIVPGLIDAHIHIESSLMIPENFASVALSHGTVATVSDPHEIANVCGLEGVYFMMRNGEKSKLKFFWTAPSCVPATAYETSGGTIDASALDSLFKEPKIVALGEMMNYPGVIHQDNDVLQKCKTARKYSRVIDGHAPGLTGAGLKSYISAGITTDHECSTLEEALEKIENGMKILIREGSSAKNFEALSSLLTTHPNDVMLCSDDLHADDLINGHINLLVKRSVSKGIPLFNVLRAVSLNPVKHYNLPVGLLRTGDPADFLIVNNLKEFNILETWVDGIQVYNGKTTEYSKNQENTINNFNTEFVLSTDLELNVTGQFARIMVVEEGSIATKASIKRIGNNFNSFFVKESLLYLFVKDRYFGNHLGKALVSGFGNLKGAIASTIAHDSHNIIAVGNSSESIADAMNLLIECKGGIAFVSENTREVLPLPVAGLMSDEPAQIVSGKYERILQLVSQHGCILKSPLMTLSFLALLVIPELKLSDKGLFDVNTFKFTELFLE